MIDYKLFDFAAPPGTGVGWFVRAAQLAGLGPGFRYHAYDRFQGDDSARLRVSLVRHPCDWLSDCWLSLTKGAVECNHIGKFAALRHDTLADFIYAYLIKMPGGVGRLYRTYQANICMRREDLPRAFVELGRSLDMPKSMSAKAGRLDLPSTTIHAPHHLCARVMEVERDVAEQYDYW